MASNNKNPLTPLKSERLSHSEKEHMWSDILTSVENDQEMAHTSQQKESRLHGVQNFLAGMAAVILVGVVLVGLAQHHWFHGTEATKSPKPPVPHQIKTKHTKYSPRTIPEVPATLFQTQVPVILLPEQLAVNTPGKPQPPKTVAVDVPSSLKGDFVAYFAYRADPTHPLYIVVPKAMKPFGQNMVGADGSFYFNFKDSNGNTFEVGTSGPCYGCSAAAGAPFFSAAEKAHEQDVPTKVPTLKSQGANVTYPQNDVALFAYSQKGAKTYGFNQYDTNMNKHVWGIDFSASYTGKTPDMNEIPWILENLIHQNEGKGGEG